MSNILATQALHIAGMGYKVDLIIVSFVDEEAGENGTLACIIRGYTGNACNFTEPNVLWKAPLNVFLVKIFMKSKRILRNIIIKIQNIFLCFDYCV